MEDTSEEWVEKTNEETIEDKEISKEEIKEEALATIKRYEKYIRVDEEDSIIFGPIMRKHTYALYDALCIIGVGYYSQHHPTKECPKFVPNEDKQTLDVLVDLSQARHFHAILNNKEVNLENLIPKSDQFSPVLNKILEEESKIEEVIIEKKIEIVVEEKKNIFTLFLENIKNY